MVNDTISNGSSALPDPNVTASKKVSIQTFEQHKVG